MIKKYYGGKEFPTIFLRPLQYEDYIIVERPCTDDESIDAWIKFLSLIEGMWVISIESTTELKKELINPEFDEHKFRNFMENAHMILNIRGGRQ